MGDDVVSYVLTATSYDRGPRSAGRQGARRGMVRTRTMSDWTEAIRPSRERGTTMSGALRGRRVYGKGHAEACNVGLATDDW